MRGLKVSTFGNSPELQQELRLLEALLLCSSMAKKQRTLHAQEEILAMSSVVSYSCVPRMGADMGLSSVAGSCLEGANPFDVGKWPQAITSVKEKSSWQCTSSHLMEVICFKKICGRVQVDQALVDPDKTLGYGGPFCFAILGRWRLTALACELLARTSRQ